MHCWPRYILWTLITVVGMGNLLTACGQKGPLYLPDKSAGQQAPTEAQEKEGQAEE